MAHFDDTLEPIGFTVDSGDGAGCPCPPHPPFPPPFPPPAPKPSAVDDNVPYNPATFADIAKVRMEIVHEAMSRINYDKYLSSEIAKIKEGGISITVDDHMSKESKNPVQNKVITSEFEKVVHLSGDEVISGVKTFEDGLDTKSISNDGVVVGLGEGIVSVSGSLYVDHGITMTRNGDPTNDIISKGYHFKYMDCTHEAEDGCIDFYLADGLWSYTPLVNLFNEVKEGTKTLEDGGGVFDSTWKCEWDGILEGTKSEFQYRTTGDDTFVNINPVMYLRNSSNYDLCLELVGLVGNKATCRLVKGVQTTMYASVGNFGSVGHQKVLAGQIPPYEGNKSAWEHDYVDGTNVDDPTDVNRISDMYTLRFTLNNVGGSVIARNQCAFGQANQTTGYSTQAFGCENIVSGKWGGTFGFGLHQLAWGENVYGRFNKTPTAPRANGLMKYPVIIGCGLNSANRRDGLKFDRDGDAIFDRHTRSKTLSDIGIQSIRKTFTGRTAIALFPSEEDALAGTNRITSAIKFVKPKANDSETMMVVPTEGGGLFWMSSFPLVNAEGKIVRNGATFAVRCKLIPGTGTTKGATWATQEQFDSATFENPAFANGKFYVTGDLGLFWSKDGKTWNQSSVVPKTANELEHFHNTSLTHIYHLTYGSSRRYIKVNSLPAVGEVVSTVYDTRTGEVIDGMALKNEDGSYIATIGGVDMPTFNVASMTDYDPTRPRTYEFTVTGGSDFFVAALPSGDEKVTKAYDKNGTAISGIVLKNVDGKYVVTVGGTDYDASFIGGDGWWRKFQEVFMLGNMISFDPSDDDGWISGQLGDKDTFVAPFLSVGVFVPMAIGAGTMTGFRAYCTSSDTGLLYSKITLTDDNKVVMKWEQCGGEGQKVKGLSCDNLACGTDALGANIVICSPLSVNAAHPEYTQPLYAKNGETAFHFAGFPASAVGTSLETSFVTNEGAVIVMCGTSEANGKGFFWTNYLNGSNTKWTRSNIKKHPWTTPTYLPSIDMYTSAAYRQEQSILISRDAKYWVASDLKANGFPPVDFAGKVIFCGRAGIENDLSYLTVTDVDETYNLGSGGSGGSLSDVKQIEGPYTDKIVRDKVNEIIVALGGTIDLIPDEFTDDDIKNKINAIITAYSN